MATADCPAVISIGYGTGSYPTPTWGAMLVVYRYEWVDVLVVIGHGLGWVVSGEIGTVYVRVSYLIPGPNMPCLIHHSDWRFQRYVRLTWGRMTSGVSFPHVCPSTYHRVSSAGTTQDIDDRAPL